jgi:hypothetical protein
MTHIHKSEFTGRNPGTPRQNILVSDRLYSQLSQFITARRAHSRTALGQEHNEDYEEDY